MTGSIVSSAFNTARSTLSACVLFAAGIVIGYICERIVYEHFLREASERVLSATSIAANIVLIDERLTMSANMAAINGDNRWIGRYESYLPDINHAIKAAVSMASPDVSERFDREVKSANDALVEMEALSMSAAKAGDLSRAQTILHSEAYIQQKRILSVGKDDLLASVLTDAKVRLEWVGLVGRVIMMSLAGFSSIGLSLLWMYAERRIRASELSQLSAEKRLQFLAQHDELTGLPNRRSFLAHMVELSADKRRNQDEVLAVAMIDLDKFKHVNDTYGHGCGDELLRQVSSLFLSNLPDNGFIARMGGDEFAVVLPVITFEQTVGDLKRLVDCLSKPIRVEGYELSMSISIGAAFSQKSIALSENLLRFADVALYQAKAHGRNRFCIYDYGARNHGGAR